MHTEDPDILTISETWLTSETCDSGIQLLGFLLCLIALHMKITLIKRAFKILVHDPGTCKSARFQLKSKGHDIGLVAVYLSS